VRSNKRLEPRGRSAVEYHGAVSSLPTEEGMMFRCGELTTRSSCADRQTAAHAESTEWQ
jgi:hypothetical protein